MTKSPTQTFQTLRLAADAAGIAAAADLLRAGRQVAFPTETVYGLGADARNDSAVAGIFAAKDRPAFNPLIVHVADLSAARALVEMTPAAEALAAACWPGPLTLVLRLRPGSGVSPLVSAGLDTVAVRVPAHAVARALLAQFGGPVAAPSANPSGRISPTSAEHVLAGLSGRIAAVLDGGACPVGVESTIIEAVGAPQLLRAGGLPVEAAEAVLGMPLLSVEAMDDVAPRSPGQLASHYAPSGTLRLGVSDLQPGEVLLGFGLAPDATLNLSERGDLTEAAANLFGHLHRLDAMGVARIAVSAIPDHGLGRAINDRLRRAAAPR